MKIISKEVLSARKTLFKMDNGKEYMLIGNVIMAHKDGEISQLERFEFHDVAELLEKESGL